MKHPSLVTGFGASRVCNELKSECPGVATVFLIQFQARASRQHLSLVFSVALFVFALRRSLIGWGTIVGSAAVFGLWAAKILLVQHRTPTESLSFAILLTGISSLVVAHLAAAPLALFWNRHR